MRSALRLATRAVSDVRAKLTILKLRIKGCRVAWSACIDPSARIEPSGGVISIGPRTVIDCGVVIRGLGGNITIGSDCAVNAYTVLCGGGDISIGDSVMIASHVSCYAGNHVYASTTEPMRTQRLETLGITIASDVWIGTGVRLLDGIEIGAGAIVAAGAVVTRAIAPMTINAGVPAGIIGTRG